MDRKRASSLRKKGGRGMKEAVRISFAGEKIRKNHVPIGQERGGARCFDAKGGGNFGEKKGRRSDICHDRGEH